MGLPDNDRGRPLAEAPSNVVPTDLHRIQRVGPVSVADTIEQEALRLIQECLTVATREYWERRARTFESCRPRPGDHTGNLTREELSEQWQRLTAMAQACRARAAITDLPDEPEQDVVNVWQEAS